jgi:serine/threonine protein kinase
MPPHIHIVYRPSEPSKKLIAKKVRKESNELAILKHLHTIQPSSEHVISLLDSFRGQSRPWVNLPRMDRVTVCIVIAPKLLESKVTQVCWGLIKGLAYLHELCIAHRDIKDEDEEVDDECGTKYWIAPEVEDKLSMYSPIKSIREKKEA